MYRTKVLSSLLAASAIYSAGCTMVLKDHQPMNAALRHVNMESCGTTSGEGQRDEVVLLPAMKLRLSYADFRAKDNDVFPAISSFEWIAPRRPEPTAPLVDLYDPKDRLFFRYLLSVMHPETGSAIIKPLALLRSAADAVPNPPTLDPDASFYAGFLERTLAKAFGTPKSISVSLSTSRTAKQTCSAESLRAQWTQPTKADDEMEWQALHVRNIGVGLSESIELSGWDWTDPLFSKPPGMRANLEANGKPRNDFYQNGSIRKPLGLIEVEIPVRVEPSVTSMYVPFVWSVHRLEERLGATIAFLRRPVDMLPASLQFEQGKKKTMRVVETKTLQDADRYVTLCFDHSARGCASAHGRTLLISTDQKAQILLSPGDVIGTRRNTQVATDSPSVR